LPGLALLLLLSSPPRQRRGEEVEVDVLAAEPLAGEAESHEVDERALAAPGIAEQDKALVPVELRERRHPLGYRVYKELRRSSAPRPEPLVLAGRKDEEGRVDRVQAQACLPVWPRDIGIDAFERQIARLL